MKKLVSLIMVMILLPAGLHAQPSAQIRGVLSQYENIKRIQSKKMRQLKQRASGPIAKPKPKPVAKVPELNISESGIISYEKLRFKNKTKAQIDSIRRVDKEKQRFYSEFLEQLKLAAVEMQRRDSLKALLDNAILSGDSNVPEVLLTPEFVTYAKDAIVGSPYEIGLYNSLYDDLTGRMDSSYLSPVYCILPGMESPVNSNLHKQIYADSLCHKTADALRDRLLADVKEYYYLFDLDPFSVSPNSIDSIVSLVPDELKKSHGEAVRTMAVMAATGNAVYNELRDVRNMRKSTHENASSLYIVKLVDLKLRLEDSIANYGGLILPDPHVWVEIDKYMHPAWNMGKYDPQTLIVFLKFLLKNDWEKPTQDILSLTSHHIRSIPEG